MHVSIWGKGVCLRLDVRLYCQAEERGAAASPRSLERRGGKSQLSRQVSHGSSQTPHKRLEEFTTPRGLGLQEQRKWVQSSLLPFLLPLFLSFHRLSTFYRSVMCQILGNENGSLPLGSSQFGGTIHMTECSAGRETGNFMNCTRCSEETFSSLRVCSLLVPQVQRNHYLLLQIISF